LAVPAGMGQSTASGSLRRPDGSSRPFRVSFTVPSPPTATKRRAPWAQRLGEKRLEGAETPDELGLDRRPALAGAAFVGGGIDDDRDLRPFPMVVPYCQKLTGEGATLAGCHARNVCSTLFKSCAAIVIQ
jgi:hypothetical protein